jgi:hypothetical protein
LKAMAQFNPIAELLAQPEGGDAQAELPGFSADRRALNHEIRRNSLVQMETLLGVVGRQFVTYFPVLAQLTRSSKAALLLGHSIYVTRAVLRDSPEQDGWFWKNTQEWFVATGLSQKEQVSARDILVQYGLLQESRQGMPAKLYFRLNLTALAVQLGQLLNSAPTAWSWEENAVRRLLGKPLAFYASMSWLVQSASGGIVLSQWVATYREVLRQPDFKSHRFTYSWLPDRWESIGVSEKTVRRTRDFVESVGLLTFERQSATHGRLMYRVNLDVLAEALAKKVNEIHSLLDSSNQDVEKPAIKILRIQQSRVTKRAEVLSPFSENKTATNPQSTSALLDKQELPKGQEYFRPFSETRVTKKAKHLITSFKKTKQQQQEVVNEGTADYTNEDRVVVVLDSDFEKHSEVLLVMPSILLEVERGTALQLLEGSKRAQVILDEVQGKSNAQPGSVRSALALIRTLVKLDNEGRFSPLYAAKVVTKRGQANVLPIQPSITKAMSIEEKQAAQERLAELRRTLKSGGVDV